MAQKVDTATPTSRKAAARGSMVRGGVGGIGKSSFLINLADVFGIAAIPLDLMQIDEQTKVERMTGQPVTSLDIAVFEKAREDGWAIQRALAPFYNALVAMPQTGRWCSLEIAGGLSGVTHDALRMIDMAEDIEELGVKVDAHILVVASEESVRQARFEAERHRHAFPGGQLIFVLNNRYGSVAKFMREVSGDVGKPLLKLVEDNSTLTMRKVQPESMRLWERLAIRPSQIAHWRVDGGYAKVCAETGLDRLEAKVFAGEIVGWWADIREQLIAIYPELGGSDG